MGQPLFQQNQPQYFKTLLTQQLEYIQVEVFLPFLEVNFLLYLHMPHYSKALTNCFLFNFQVNYNKCRHDLYSK